MCLLAHLQLSRQHLLAAKGLVSAHLSIRHPWLLSPARLLGISFISALPHLLYRLLLTVDEGASCRLGVCLAVASNYVDFDRQFVVLSGWYF